MGILNWLIPPDNYVWMSRAASATGSSRRKANAATAIDKEDFAMALPGLWEEQSTDHGCEFVNRSAGELLIVSILRSPEMAAAAELRPTTERLDAIRRKMIEDASQRQAMLGPTQFRGTERDLEARFDGYDPQDGVRFSVVIRGCPPKVLILSFYRDSLAELAIPFTVYASLIFNLLKVKGG
jgi:hypothetical protein